jgi:methionyl-tRNA formyltransferase
MRLAFMGTPDFAVPALEHLIASGHELACVYTRAPKPRDRGQLMQVTPIQELAEKRGIPVRCPKSLRGEAEQVEFAALKLDAAVVAAYGLILPRQILEAPRLGCLNIHASLLPRWRGAAPIQRAIEAGDVETGITIMQMDEGLDTGAMLLRAAVPIDSDTTAQSLHDRLAQLGGELVVEALSRLDSGALHPKRQDDAHAVYAKKLEKSEGKVDWAQPAAVLDRRIRAFTPWPGGHFDCGGESVKIRRARLAPAKRGAPGEILDAEGDIGCGEGALRLIEVQRPGRAPVSGAEFLRGVRLGPGDRLA